MIHSSLFVFHENCTIRQLFLTLVISQDQVMVIAPKKKEKAEDQESSNSVDH
jgi:hypothetical protein